MSLVDQLTALESSGLIRLADAPSELEYLFRHALMQDAAYESMLKADRKRLHLIIGETLERVYADPLAEIAPMLARHFLEADDRNRARHYFALAGETALANFANAEAENHCRVALNLTPTDNERAQLLSNLGEALLRQSRFGEADQIWQDAIRVYLALENYEGVARTYARAARTAGTAYGGDAPRALALCRMGLAAVDGQTASPALAALLHEAGRACFFNGLLDEAGSYCRQALTLAERLNDVATQADTLATVYGLLPTLSPQAAIEGLQRAAGLAETVGRLDTAARIYHNLGYRYGLEQGELLQGQTHVQRAIELLGKIGDEAGQFYTLDIALIISFLAGDFDEVENILKAMKALLHTVANQDLGLAGLRGWEAWLHRCRGEWEAARVAFQTACTGLRHHQAFDTLANINCTLADLLLELNDLTLAGEVLQETSELVERGFMEPVEPRSLLVALYARQGRVAEAQRVLTETREQAGPHLGTFNRLALAVAEARLAVAERHWSSAFAAFEAACAHAARHHIRWQHAQTLCEWAEAHLTRNEPGDADHAKELLCQASALFEEINVPKYAARVNERLAALK